VKRKGARRKHKASRRASSVAALSSPPQAEASGRVSSVAALSTPPQAEASRGISSAAALSAPQEAEPRNRLDSGEHSIPPAPRTRLFAHIDLHTESNFFSGFSGDLSDGGVFVATYEPLTLGQPVHVELSLPGGKFASADGRVAFLRAPSLSDLDLAPGAGVVFESLDDDVLRAANQFMARREPLFVDPDLV
jgi:uncharacterized protein (TIGR02266 family)